ncbi:MAG: ABC transporter substrate-binding protein [Desulfobacteraceae bacterium]|nr:ABC transporter substrate-binding protein [Desulfobacteraceae bacterium]
MKKKILILALIAGCNLVWMAMVAFPENQFVRSFLKKIHKKERIVVALAGPMTGEGGMNGRDMVRGARMAIKDAVRAGRLSDLEIRLNLFDDKNEIRSAMKAASEISLDKEVVAVLGHYLTATTIAAAGIYEKNGIPMITGSAAGEMATDENSWAFGTIPDNGDQAVSIIIRARAMKRHISVIHEMAESYNSLIRGIEASAAEANVDIRYSWELKASDENRDERLEQIINDLRAIQDPGIIIIATQSREAAAIIRGINHPGTDYTIIGTETFATIPFYEALTSLPQERVKPGYYLNGIYGSTPFLPEWGGPESRRFAVNYRDRYGEFPTWVAACYYDAMKVLIEAIELKHITGRKVREDRADIRAALAGFTNPEEAVEGVTGRVFFDGNGRVERLYDMGYYENQRFRPALTQYHVIARDRESVFKKDIGSKVTVAGGKVFSQKNLVFTGMDINAVDSLNVRSGEFIVDFYIWFRSSGDFNEKHLIFENSEAPIRLREPVLEIRQDDFTVRAYQVKAKFKQPMRYDEFPFEKHRLTIRFHHKLHIDRKLVFIPDYLSMGAGPSPDRRQIPMVNTSGWKVDTVTQTRDTFKKQVGSFSLAYSRYNAHISVERMDGLFALKFLIPLLSLALFLSFSHLLPMAFAGTRLFIIFFVELATCICDYFLGTIHPSSIILQVEVNFFAIYALGIVSALVTCAGIISRRMDSHKWFDVFTYTGQGIHVLVIAWLIGMNVIKLW